MNIPVTYLLSCEHAGNEIPAAYTHLFKGQEDTLLTHKAIDFGALWLAKKVASELGLPLHYTRISRLLVETNRSVGNEALFSEFSQKLTEAEKKQVLEQYYYPHRNAVEEEIAAAVSAGKRVVHLALHTFTPVLDSEIRKAEIGILFDPKRPLEKAFAQKLRTNLLTQNPQRKVQYNAPYPGTDDGFPTYLRQLFDKEHYAGFELEINQKFFLTEEPEAWEQLVGELVRGLKAVMKDGF